MAAEGKEVTRLGGLSWSPCSGCSFPSFHLMASAQLGISHRQRQHPVHDEHGPALALCMYWLIQSSQESYAMMLDVVLLLLFFKMRNLRPVVAKQLSPGHTAVGG